MVGMSAPLAVKVGWEQQNLDAGTGNRMRFAVMQKNCMPSQIFIELASLTSALASLEQVKYKVLQQHHIVLNTPNS